MSTTIGAFEAKTHLSALLDRVEQGEEVVITKHGRPVARLTPVRPAASVSEDGDLFELMRRQRAGRRLALDWRQLRDEGRKG
ncbi:MAG TPA: type II toxin-antitoxin system Phd/YefM family antitoxin [Burkholderiaceae bacterium]|nr:type II toxin-antitoxin system Phd/YefM family antitoxin [Burkholderiaceae bacterium]